jgi:hypothetical protein
MRSLELVVAALKVHAGVKVWVAAEIGEARLVDSHQRREFL